MDFEKPFARINDVQDRIQSIQWNFEYILTHINNLNQFLIVLYSHSHTHSALALITTVTKSIINRYTLTIDSPSELHGWE